MANLISKSNKPLLLMTKLEAEKESKRRAFEEEERIEALGQTSDLKAKPWIQKDLKEKQEQEKQFRDLAYTKLFSLRKDRIKYNQFLVSLLIEFIKDEDISRRHKLKVSWTKEGVVLDILKRNYQGAFKSCYIPQVDLLACKMLAIRLGNTVSRIEGYVSQTDSGILIPDKREYKIAMENYGRDT